MSGSGRLAERFLRLFDSNKRSVGRFHPGTKKIHTDHQQVTIGDVERHFKGEWGLGLVPILDDDTCKWAAIDIDNHGQETDIPIGSIDERLSTDKSLLKLIPCRSKSGGVHVYAFFSAPWPARKAKAFLLNAAGKIGYRDAEIFPKQTHLTTNVKEKQRGNWLNLPYLLADDTVRYAFKNGRKLTLGEFLTLAEGSRIEERDHAPALLESHQEAPPCVQRMVTDGVSKGQRNEALYQITVYTRKAFPIQFKDVAVELADVVFDKALSDDESRRTIISAGRPDCQYRCADGITKAYCDRDVCLTRKFGIRPSDPIPITPSVPLPVFSDVIKYLTDPVRWGIKINDHMVTNIETEDLLDWRWVRRTVAEKLTTVVPMIKNQEWEDILKPLMAQARIIEAPEDAGPAGLIRSRFREFAAKAQDLRGNKNVNDRQALLRGLPIMTTVDGVKQLAFRQEDFIQFLKRTKSEELKGANIWFAIREFGLRHMRMRVSDRKSVNVWLIPYKEIELPEPDPLEFKSEL